MQRILPINIDRNVSPSYFKPGAGTHLLVTSIFLTFQGEGPYAGFPAVFVRLAGCNLGSKQDCPWCFPETETISTPNGIKKFSEINCGDNLYTLDENGTLVTTTVSNVLTKNVTKKDLVCINYKLPTALGTKKLYVTKDHPFSVVEKGFVAAKDLVRGNLVYHVEGKDIVSANMKFKNPALDPLSRLKGASTARRNRSERLVKKRRTSAHRASYSASKLGDKNPMKRHSVRLKNALSHSYKQSSLELRFESIFEVLEMPVQYVGNNGAFAVGDDKSGYKMPDFILSDSKVIEVYDCTAYYGQGEEKILRTRENYEEPLREFYKRFGVDVLFLTQQDIPRIGSGYRFTLDNFSGIYEKVGMFLRNGAEVLEVRELTDIEYSNRCDVTGTCPVVNFSCTPHNTFVVGNLLTHNCDTFFAIDSAKEMTISDVRNEILRLSGSSPILVVITGGEPLLQTPSLEVLMKDHNLCAYQFQIETNGYYLESNTLPRADVVISPKVPHNHGKYAPIKPSWVTRNQNSILTLAKGNTYLKYVLSADPSSNYHTVPDDALDTNNIIFVSGMAVYKREYKRNEVANIWDATMINKEQTFLNYKYAAQYAVKRNLRVSFQTHLFAGME